MSKGLNLTLHNWRSFSNLKIKCPEKSFCLIDENGSGKTSLLSAIYSLISKRAWPGTKFSDHLKSNTEYFGVSTNYVNWSILSQISPSGRLTTKIERPENELNIFNFNLSKTNTPIVLTYQPTDNYWLSLSRSQKLGILDTLLVQSLGSCYEETLKDLDKLVKNKQKLLKQAIDNQTKGDLILVKTFSQKILELSKKIWTFRSEYFVLLEKQLPTFSTWINSPLKNWLVKWETTNLNGLRLKTDTHNPQALEESPDWLKLWEKELIVGKVLFGAQRDDFLIECNHLNVNTVFSRGEMRLFVLFLKSLVAENTKQRKEIWWFLDDLFNELDSKREDILYQKLLKQVDFFIATGTKKPNLDLDCYSLESLKS